MNETLYTFAHVTDTHLYHATDSPAYTDPKHLAYGYGPTLDVVTPFIESLNAEMEHPLPDFVVFGGDNIDGGIPGPFDNGLICERQMRRLKSILERLRAPYYLVGHTHDVWGEDPEGIDVILGRLPDLPAGRLPRGLGMGAAMKRYFGEPAFRRVLAFPGDFKAIFMSECQMEDGVFMTIEKQLPWIEQTLEAARDQWVLFFSHVPLIWPRHPERHDQFPNASDSYNFSGSHAPLRKLFARHGRVLAHYSGHLHVHGHAVEAGTHHVVTNGLCNYAGEYRFVTVKRHSIKHRCIRIPALGNQPVCWTKCGDARHPTPKLFHDGLPEERDFEIRYN